jgi:hypothetical protein
MSLVKPDEWLTYVQTYQDLGATHVTVNTMGCGFTTTSAHIDALKQFAQSIGLAAIND